MGFPTLFFFQIESLGEKKNQTFKTEVHNHFPKQVAPMNR